MGHVISGISGGWFVLACIGCLALGIGNFFYPLYTEALAKVYSISFFYLLRNLL
jgi:hypothetical protein